MLIDPGYKINNLSNQLEASNYEPSVSLERSCIFGLDCLDDGLKRIFSDDLILIGAPTGMGKTQLCAHLAVENAKIGKKVYYVALEASENEIKDRILYRLYTKHYFDDEFRQFTKVDVNFINWSCGELNEVFLKYKVSIESEMQDYPERIKIITRTKEFSIKTLEKLNNIAKVDKPDLYIIDHAHYFDYDTTNDNKALKDITMACRDITQLHGIPVVLIAHLRKKSKDSDAVAGLEEFHGSSDLTKIATRVITLSQGAARDKLIQTFFRVSKDRRGSQLTRYITVCEYNLDLQSYDKSNYYIGKFDTNKLFQPVSNEERPGWAINSTPMLARM